MFPHLLGLNTVYDPSALIIQYSKEYLIFQGFLVCLFYEMCKNGTSFFVLIDRCHLPLTQLVVKGPIGLLKANKAT